MANDSSSAETTTVFNARDPSSTLLTVNMSNITKLTNANYLMWSKQICALLEGLELHGFLDETTMAAATILNAEGQNVVNPDYTPWRRQDRLLYSALIGAISTPLQSVVSSATTTAQIWNLLAQTFGNPSRGHIRQLKNQVNKCTKGTKTISEYLRTIKTKTDELAELGKPMDLEAISKNVLAGLPDEYKPDIDAIHGRDSAISFAELHERLLNREAMLLCKEPAASLDVPVTANATDTRSRNSNMQNNWRGPNRNNNNRNYSNQGSHNSHQGSYNSNQGSYNRGSRPYLGRCQACGIQGHSAKNCPEFQIIRGTNTSNQAWRPQFQQQTWYPRANVAMMNGDANTWLLDSGASHHMTSDIANLSLHTPYNGGDDVILGDGSGLNISHTSSLSLPSLKHPFFIDNVLFVPALDKNLLSVFQLCKTNGVAVTFTPTYFQVRDLSTGALRLEGKPENGTYQWPKAPTSTPPSLSFASATSTTLSDWHSRLGHPAASILQTMLSTFHLPLSSKALKNKPCNACSINKMHKLPFSVSTLISTSPLEVVFSDVWTSPLLSIDNFKYYVIFVDRFTRYTWLYPLQRKSQVSEVFQRFKVLVENRFQSKIKTLYTDNGGEYIALTAFLAANGISHYTSPPHTPEHNGIS